LLGTKKHHAKPATVGLPGCSLDQERQAQVRGEQRRALGAQELNNRKNRVRIAEEIVAALVTHSPQQFQGSLRIGLEDIRKRLRAARRECSQSYARGHPLGRRWGNPNGRNGVVHRRGLLRSDQIEGFGVETQKRTVLYFPLKGPPALQLAGIEYGIAERSEEVLQISGFWSVRSFEDMIGNVPTNLRNFDALSLGESVAESVG
jgi:hypothetical protein